MSGGTGELESSSSDSEGGVRVPIIIERFATTVSYNALHPPNYPVESICISTSTVSILIQVAGITAPLTDENLLAIAREHINSASRR